MIESYRIVFINGHWIQSLSQLKDLPSGVIINSLTPALGISIFIPANVIIDRPIHLLNLGASDEENKSLNLCFVIVAGENSRAVIFEEYASEAKNAYSHYQQTKIEAGVGAHIQYYKLQKDNQNIKHFAKIAIEQQHRSVVNSFHFSLGAIESQDDLTYRFLGPEAKAQLIGFYLGQNQQAIKHETRVEHAFENCISQQLYKGIATDAATISFNGKVIVSPRAQKTQAQQRNQHLLLSQEACANTKPELEIYADDVSCTHGATTGELDEAALFYLQSRGITESSARYLLTQGFVNEILMLMPNKIVSQHIKHFLYTQLEAITEGDAENVA